MKIVTIVGARPQFVKAAVVSRAVAAQSGVEEVIVHTGQHFDDLMSDVFFREMRIPEPKHHLGIGGLSHGAMTGRMIEAIERVLQYEKPQLVLVYGDTNSTLAGTLAAVKLHIDVGHVEAGLRSFNRAMPEEINRVLTDHAARLLFAPTRTAVENLAREGIAGESVHLVGDVMFDATLVFGEVAARHSRILETLDLAPKTYALATLHRQENTDDPARLRAALGGLMLLARTLPVVLPLHPRTRLALERAGADTAGLRIVDPVGYLDMLRLEQGARLILTDSGGVQKEAWFHRVPCVTLRDETEWVELVEAGANRLAPPHDARSVADAAQAMLALAPEVFERQDLYGDGHAAEKIVAGLRRGR